MSSLDNRATRWRQALSDLPPRITGDVRREFPASCTHIVQHIRRACRQSTARPADRSLNREWYTSGRPYRALSEIDGTPNPIFTDWLAHPDRDGYWRAMLPQGNEYANIKIPVLQTAGYFFGGPGAATYYFLQHTKYNPGAEHYLLIGPYDHFQAQHGVVTALGDTTTYFARYEIDPVARIDILADLRYQWFDYVLRGATGAPSAAPPLPPPCQ